MHSASSVSLLHQLPTLTTPYACPNLSKRSCVLHCPGQTSCSRHHPPPQPSPVTPGPADPLPHCPAPTSFPGSLPPPSSRNFISLLNLVLLVSLPQSAPPAWSPDAGWGHPPKYKLIMLLPSPPPLLGISALPVAPGSGIRNQKLHRNRCRVGDGEQGFPDVLHPACLGVGDMDEDSCRSK